MTVPAVPRFARTRMVVFLVATTLLLTQILALGSAVNARMATGPVEVTPSRFGELDCNGLSPIQKPVKRTLVCADPRTLYEGVASRFTDNGVYVGHDEPSIRFLSEAPGSGNNVTWNEQLPLDPAALPTAATPEAT